MLLQMQLLCEVFLSQEMLFVIPGIYYYLYLTGSMFNFSNNANNGFSIGIPSRRDSYGNGTKAPNGALFDSDGRNPSKT